MAGVAAVIGLLMAGGRDVQPILLIFLAVFFVTGAGNAVNDYFDREIDAVNRPDRPIPSGRVTPRQALMWSYALFVAGCILAALLNLLSFFIAIVNSILLYLYARNLKTTLLMGNICVAYLTGSTFLFGGAVLGYAGMNAVLIPFWLSSLATMSREIMKDVEDMEGDSRAGARTLPILAGEKLSGVVAAIFAFVAIVLSYQPVYGMIYLGIVALADVFLAGSVWKIVKKDASGSQRALKLGMAVALLAFFAAAVRHTLF